MITIELFALIILLTLFTIYLAFKFLNPAFAGFSIILLLLLAWIVAPGGLGIDFVSGITKTVAETTFNGTTNSTVVEVKTYQNESNNTLFTLFLLMIFYLALEINNFVRERKKNSEEENHYL